MRNKKPTSNSGKRRQEKGSAANGGSQPAAGGELHQISGGEQPARGHHLHEPWGRLAGQPHRYRPAVPKMGGQLSGKSGHDRLRHDVEWNAGHVMAQHIAEGLGKADPQANVTLYNLAKSDRNDVMTEIFKSRAIVVGSPTINRGVLTSIAALLEEMKGLKFRNKKAAAFGCYGWSGESVKMIRGSLKRRDSRRWTTGSAASEIPIRRLFNPVSSIEESWLAS